MLHNLTDRENQLVELWNRNFSQSEIAREMGVSLGSVSGLAMRLKTRGVIQHKTREQVVTACSRAASSRPAKEPSKVTKKKEKPPEPVKMAPPPPPPPLPLIADDVRAGVGILALNGKTCRWVLPHRGDDGMALFCGDRIDHRNFCAHHAARAFTLPNDWKKQPSSFRHLRKLLTVKAPV